MSDSASPTPSDREIELKLVVSPDSFERLKTHPALGGRSRMTTRILESTYFDTPNLDLSRRAATLRLRRSDRGFTQTIKAPPDAGSITRGEWEWPVSGPDPDLTVVLDDEPARLLGPVRPDELRPVFATVAKRGVRKLLRDGAEIEIAFDQGELRLPDGRVAPLCEIELELKAGDARALWEVARAVVDAEPIRVERRTKAARGFALAAGRLDRAVKSDGVSLGSDTTVEEAIRLVFGSCLIHLMNNEACVLNGDDAEGVHQLRVATRRLRSALSLFRPVLPRGDHFRFLDDVKWLGAALGPARDWDVFHDELVEPVRLAVGIVSEEDFRALDAAISHRRAEARAAARAAVTSPRHARFQIDFGEWLESRGWRRQDVSEDSARLFSPLVDLADALLDRRHRKARRAGRGFADLSSARRHELRIALKKLRYTAEFFQTLHDPRAARRYITRLADLQDSLGRLNDMATAHRLSRDLHAEDERVDPGEARAVGIVLGWHARAAAGGETDLVRRWNEFAEAKPFWSPPSAGSQE